MLSTAGCSCSGYYSVIVVHCRLFVFRLLQCDCCSLQVVRVQVTTVCLCCSLQVVHVQVTKECLCCPLQVFMCRLLQCDCCSLQVVRVQVTTVCFCCSLQVVRVQAATGCACVGHYRLCLCWQAGEGGSFFHSCSNNK